MPCPSGGVRMVWLPSILTTTVALRAISRELRGRTRTTTRGVSFGEINGSVWGGWRGYLPTLMLSAIFPHSSCSPPLGNVGIPSMK